MGIDRPAATRSMFSRQILREPRYFGEKVQHGG